MNCPYCGSPLSGTKFCTNCGVSLEQAATSASGADASGNVRAAHTVPPQPAPMPIRRVSSTQNANPYASYAPNDDILYARTDSDTTLCLIAFVLAVIATVCAGLLIIPLAWMIPMTVRTWGIYKGKKPNTVAFGVCSLLFLDLIGGILLLVAEKDI